MKSPKNKKELRCFKSINEKSNIDRSSSGTNSEKSCYGQKTKLKKAKKLRSFKNIKKSNIFVSLKKNDYLFFVVLSIILFICVGYAKISDTVLNINGEASSVAQDGIFITNITKTAEVETESSVNYFYASMFESKVVLNDTNNFSETFEITVYNRTEREQVFIGALTDILDNMLYDNENIEFVLNGIEQYKTSILPEEYLTFTITYKYKDNADTTNNVLNNKINFRFREMPKLILTGVTTELDKIYPNCPTQEYYFKVENFENDNINQIPLTYKVKATVDAPLKVKIYNENGEEILEDTTIIGLGDGTKETQNYKLEIIWDNSNPENGKEYNSLEYADKDFNFKIELIATLDKVNDVDEYLGYTLNEEENVVIESEPMYFNSLASNTELLMRNNRVKLELTLKNNDGTNYNTKDVKYKININNENLLLEVDGVEITDDELVLSADEIINKIHDITLMAADVHHIPQTQECTIAIEALEPYVKKEEIILNITNTGILKPGDDPADSAIQFGTTFGTIEVIWLEDKTNVVTPTPNAPELYTHLGDDKKMTPVTWTYHEEGIIENGLTVNWTEDETPKEQWYDYRADYGIDGRIDNTKSMWANAKNSDGSYFVWIPRYAYRITYYSDRENKIAEGYFDGYGLWRVSDGKKKFELDPGVEYVEYNGKSYIVHPAFMKDTGKVDSEGNPLPDFDRGGWDDNLTGIWIAKYEMSRAGATATASGSGYNTTFYSLPGVMSATSVRTGDFLGAGLKYDADKFSHMMKMSEWGVVTYLTESQFGRNAHEIDTNGTKITGNGSNTTTDSYADEEGEVIEAHPYNTVLGAKASSTGNIYGVYDISGCSWEYIASYNKLAEPLRLTNANGKPFTQHTKDPVTGEYISTKFATAYYNETRENRDPSVLYRVGKVGDATKEFIISESSAEQPLYWYHDNAAFTAYTVPYWGRGGGCTEAPYTGIFYSDSTSGGAYGTVSFRIALGQ